MGLALLLSPGLIPESESHPRVSRGDNTTGSTAPGGCQCSEDNGLTVTLFVVSRRYQLVLKETKMSSKCSKLV